MLVSNGLENVNNCHSQTTTLYSRVVAIVTGAFQGAAHAITVVNVEKRALYGGRRKRLRSFYACSTPLQKRNFSVRNDASLPATTTTATTRCWRCGAVAGARMQVDTTVAHLTGLEWLAHERAALGRAWDRSSSPGPLSTATSQDSVGAHIDSIGGGARSDDGTTQIRLPVFEPTTPSILSNEWVRAP
ncbi:hypothetical protein MTO96_046652 [Rhipicephalus appendiculatus]